MPDLVGLDVVELGDRKASDFVMKNMAIDGTDPDSDNDVSQGYSAGSMWTNTAGPSVWVCVDSTDAAAVWVQLY